MRKPVPNALVIDASKLQNFDSLCQLLVSNFQGRVTSYFYDGDVINAWCHARELGRVPAGKIAEHLQCSRAFVCDLAKVARFFPAGVREMYADQTWGWFRAVMRMPEGKTMPPEDLCAKYADCSLRELADLKAQMLGKREEGIRLSVTLVPERYRELTVTGKTQTTSMLTEDGTPRRINVTLQMETPIDGASQSLEAESLTRLLAKGIIT